MMYEFDIRLMHVWTRELLEATQETKCGAHLGLENRENANYLLSYAIYCEWEMTPGKWFIWQRRFLRR